MKKKRNAGLFDALERAGSLMRGANATIDLHDKLAQKKIIKPIIGKVRQQRNSIGIGALLGHAANAGVAISSGLSIADRYQRIDERKKKARMKKRNPFDAQISLPADISARLGDEHINDILSTPEPVETLRALAAQALVEDDYYGVADYERLIAILTAAETLETEGVRNGAFTDAIINGAGWTVGAGAVAGTGLAAYLASQERKVRRAVNPAYTVHVESPSVRESVEVHAYTQGGALRKGRARLRGKAKIHPKWSVEKNPAVIYNSEEAQRWAQEMSVLDGVPYFVFDIGDNQYVVSNNTELTENSTIFYPTKENPSRKHKRGRIAVLVNPSAPEYEGMFLSLPSDEYMKIGETGFIVTRENDRNQFNVLYNGNHVFAGTAADVAVYFADMDSLDSEQSNPLSKRFEKLYTAEQNLRDALQSAEYHKDTAAAKKIRTQIERVYNLRKREESRIDRKRNGLKDIPSSIKSKLNKNSRMFHGPHNPLHGRVRNVHVSNRVKARHFSRAGSIPGIKLEADATGRHAAPNHFCEECTIITNPDTSFLGISTGKRVQPLGNGVLAAGKRLKRNLDRMNPEELSELGVTRETSGGYNLGKANTQWYTTVEKWSDIDDPDLINYFHEWAEETREYDDKPNAKLDEEGMIYLQGGKHTVTEAGIEN